MLPRFRFVFRFCSESWISLFRFCHANLFCVPGLVPDNPFVHWSNIYRISAVILTNKTSLSENGYFTHFSNISLN